MRAEPGPSGRRRVGFLPALGRPAWVVLGADVLSAIGTGLTLPCLFIYAHQVHHLSDGAAGLVVSTVALVSLAGNPAGGALADRWTPRRALMAGLAIAAAGSAGLALARSPAELFGAAGLTGFGVAVGWPAQDALLASLAGPRTRSAVFSVRHASMNAGLGLGSLAAAALISTSHPGTFVVVYLADAVSFLIAVLVLACTGSVARNGPAASPVREVARIRYRDIFRDRAFAAVWLLTAVIVTASFGQLMSSFAGYATRPGGISAHGLSLAFAANMLTVTATQLFVLRWLSGRRRTTGAALACLAWAAAWALVITGGRLGGGFGAGTVFAAAMVVFALGESMLSPTLSAIINDLAPAEAAGRYNGLGALAFTTGFLLGPAIGGAALSLGWGTGLFAALALSCVLCAVAAVRIGRRLPPHANQVTPAARVRARPGGAAPRRPAGRAPRAAPRSPLPAAGCHQATARPEPRRPPPAATAGSPGAHTSRRACQQPR
jgi:MFS family permease